MSKWPPQTPQARDYNSPRAKMIKEWLNKNRTLWPRSSASIDYKLIIDKAYEDGIYGRNTGRSTVRMTLEKILLKSIEN